MRQTVTGLMELPAKALILAVALCVLCIQAAAQTQVPALGNRVALLIGNGTYERPDLNLVNPVRDANALAEALGTHGFQVIEVLDQTRAEMVSALREFESAANGAEIAMVFYAGHGVQLADENYLIGTDFGGTSPDDLIASSLTMTELRQALERAKPAAGIVILDACRNTPFSESGMAAPGLLRARGGAGLLFAFATDPGNVAFDGRGDNSVFTGALLDHLATPGLDIRLMLGRVRQQVVIETFGRQVPWVEEALLGEHSIAQADTDTSRVDPVAAEVLRWREVTASSDPGAYADYLNEFPDGLFAPVAQEFLAYSQRPPVEVDDGQPFTLASADIAPATSALSTLGLLPQSRSLLILDRGAIVEAFDAYRRRKPAPQTIGLDDLYADAGRITLVLASATAQRIRTDIVALRAVGRTKKLAIDALAQIERIAETNADAVPILQQAREDFAAIETSEATILNRLDQSREYYSSLLYEASKFMPDGATLDLLGGADATRGIAGVDQRALNDAARFLTHVASARGDRAGSLVWMGDFLPQG